MDDIHSPEPYYRSIASSEGEVEDSDEERAKRPRRKHSGSGGEEEPFSMQPEDQKQRLHHKSSKRHSRDDKSKHHSSRHGEREKHSSARKHHKSPSSHREEHGSSHHKERSRSHHSESDSKKAHSRRSHTPPSNDRKREHSSGDDRDRSSSKRQRSDDAEKTPQPEDADVKERTSSASASDASNGSRNDQENDTGRVAHHSGHRWSKYDSDSEEDLQNARKVSPRKADVGSDEDVVTDDEEEVYELKSRERWDAADLADKDFDELTEEEKAALSPETLARKEDEYQRALIAQLPIYFPGVSGCRNVAEFECLNRIEEGTFGVVYRAREKKTDEIVALKRLKMEREKEGFPITSLREVNMLLKAGAHPNVVNVREIVVGTNMDKIYLVMEYVEHDMKALMDTMKNRKKSLSIGQVKTLLHQLLSGCAHMHSEWILHRDLKTSNLLLSHKGILKIGDFGLAREFGEPLKEYTPIVVTLWYRAPELLLGCKKYSTPIDMWSVGCIFAEFLKLSPLFPGKGEIDELNKIFTELGTPSEKIWPGFSELPGIKMCNFTHYPYNQLRKKFGSNVITDLGFQLLNKFLTYSPAKRISAEDALKHPWFAEDPQPIPPEMFPTWPAKSELSKIPTRSPPRPTKNAAPGHEPTQAEIEMLKQLNVDPRKMTGGFNLKFDAPKF